MSASANLTANEQLALDPSKNIRQYRAAFANVATGKTDLRKVKIALVAVAAKWNVATEVIGMTTKVMRRHLNSVLAASDVGTVKQVSQGVRQTSGSVDKGMVTETDVAVANQASSIDAKLDTLIVAVTALTAAIAAKS